MSVLAVIAARNEAGYIGVTLASLIEDGVEVMLLDHGSIDGTRELAEPFLGRGLIGIEHVPWRGVFDLRELLERKQEVYQSAPHDWLMHVDADEWPRAASDETLAEFLDRVDDRFSVVNFDEFVFLPPLGADLWGRDYRVEATDYYFYEFAKQRLMRAWRSSLALSNVSGSGHVFEGLDPALVYPRNLTKRHYVGLSWSHAIAKRANRTYSERNLAMGWHENRLDMRAARPVIDSPLVKTASPWDTRTLDTSSPTPVHFWHPDFG